MGWQFIVASILAIPIIMFPAALIWYFNLRGTGRRLSDARHALEEYGKNSGREPLISAKQYSE